jgi:hypothetical protein
MAKTISFLALHNSFAPQRHGIKRQPLWFGFRALTLSGAR